MRLPIHPYLRPEQVEFDHAAAEKRDRRGHRFHIVFGVLCCFVLCGPTIATEVAGAPLAVLCLIRLPYMWRTLGSVVVQPLFLAILAWVAWQATTLAWSPDVKQGLHEVGANRWVWVMVALWPIMRYRLWLIAALAAGMLCGNLVQLLGDIGVHWGVGWLVWWPRAEDRNSGWWDPVVGGSLLVAALGLHLPAALMGRGKWRWVGVGGVIVTLLAIGATGTRGAWIAAASLCEVTITMTILRERPVSRMVTRLVVVLLATAVIFGAVYLAKGDSIRRRIAEAREDIAKATNLDHPDFKSDTGARVLMGAMAIRAVKAHPVGGVGAGGYRAWTLAEFRAAGVDVDHEPPPIHQHPHSAPLMVASTTGMVGLLLAGLVVYLAVRGGFRELGPPGETTGIGSYAAGPVFGLIGLLLAGMFDPVHLNAQTGAMMAVLMGMCMVSRPVGKGRRDGGT